METGESINPLKPALSVECAFGNLCELVHGSWYRISAGAGHSLGLSHSGCVYSFGQGSFGQLGHRDTDNREVPTAVERLWAVGVLQAGIFKPELQMPVSQIGLCSNP